MNKKPLLKRIDHIEIVVRDVKEYVEFLGMLGFELVRKTNHHHGSAEMKLPGDRQPYWRYTGWRGTKIQE